MQSRTLLFDPLGFALWAAESVEAGIGDARAEVGPGPEGSTAALATLLRVLIAEGLPFQASCLVLAWSALNPPSPPEDADGLFHALQALSGPRHVVRDYVAAQRGRSTAN